jgi:hypothetical protein
MSPPLLTIKTFLPLTLPARFGCVCSEQESRNMVGEKAVPVECQGVDFDKALGRLPASMGELFFTAGEQRLRELNQAMAVGSASAVMDAAHSLASLTGILPIQALGGYARDIYAAAERNDLGAARHAHERLSVVLSWALGRARGFAGTGAAV